MSQNVMFSSQGCCDASEKNGIDGIPYPWILQLSKKCIEVAVSLAVYFSSNLPGRCPTQGYQKIVDLNLKMVGKCPEIEIRNL